MTHPGPPPPRTARSRGPSSGGGLRRSRMGHRPSRRARKGGRATWSRRAPTCCRAGSSVEPHGQVGQRCARSGASIESLTSKLAYFESTGRKFQDTSNTTICCQSEHGLSRLGTGRRLLNRFIVSTQTRGTLPLTQRSSHTGHNRTLTHISLPMVPWPIRAFYPFQHEAVSVSRPLHSCSQICTSPTTGSHVPGGTGIGGNGFGNSLGSPHWSLPLGTAWLR